ncbi:hypothetical protein DFH28DRAFT_938655 [Melampsora americana]|nr:hypothetical protein DFH28DRAFT_938655 [Melampsora americana]
MPPDASDTGQMVEGDHTDNTPDDWTDPNASSQNDEAVAAFLKGSSEGLPQVEITSDTLGINPKRTEVPLLVEYSRKRARASTPGLTAQEHVQEVTGTPRTERMARLIPGCEEDRSLTVMLAKLVAVANDAIQLPAKGRIAKKISIDTDTAADLLVLINGAFDLNEFEKSKRQLFRKPASALAGSTRAAAPIMNPPTGTTPRCYAKASALTDQEC